MHTAITSSTFGVHDDTFISLKAFDSSDHGKLLDACQYTKRYGTKLLQITLIPPYKATCVVLIEHFSWPFSLTVRHIIVFVQILSRGKPL